MAQRRSLRQFLVDDSMSLALFGLFILCLAGQALTGWHDYNATLRGAQLPSLRLGAYLRTGDFLDGAFSNWQAAILQLAVLISFSAVLRQRGAAHSRRPAPPSHRRLQLKLHHHERLGRTLYANSLSIAFFASFLALFGLHLLFADWKYNASQALLHQPPMGLAAYAGSADFWFSVFQCWEAEFGAIGLYIVASIFLRQEHSAESKPVAAADAQTGGANE